MGKFIRSFGFAFSGLGYALRTQLNFRIHIFIAFFIGITGYWLQLSTNEWLWVVSAVGMVLMTELLNTAIEVLVDLVSPEIHPKAKIIKDVAAGAVLVTAISAAMIGLIIFIPKILQHAT